MAQKSILNFFKSGSSIDNGNGPNGNASMEKSVNSSPTATGGKTLRDSRPASGPLNDIQSKILDDNATMPSTSQVELNSDISTVKSVSKNKRKFLKKWTIEFEWLIFDELLGVAYCKICRDRATGDESEMKLVSGFKGPFKVETFKFHNVSAFHKQSKEICIAKNTPEHTPLAQCVKKLESHMFDHLKVLFNTAYYIAKTNKPFSDMESLIGYAKKLQVNVNSREYVNNVQCREFVKVIAEMIKANIVNTIKSSYFSILLDGSTDKSVMEEMIIYARYLRNNEIEESFIGLIPLENSTAEGYLKGLQTEFVHLDIEWHTRSGLVGIGTDGAASMLGAQNGLCTKLKKNFPHLISTHCVAHRLQLSVLSCVKHINSVAELDSTLVMIFKFYCYSTKRCNELQKTAQALHQKILKLQKLHKVRWVASKLSTIRAVLVDYEVCCTHLENIANNNEKQDSSTAKGILKKLRDYKFVILAHFLMDFLKIFKDLSLTFQKQDLLLSHVNINVKRALQKLNKLKENMSQYEEQFHKIVSLQGIYNNIQLTNCVQGSNSFKCDRKRLIDEGILALQNRFETQQAHSNINDAISVFDTLTWPTGKALENFGSDKIKILIHHFSNVLLAKEKGCGQVELSGLTDKALDEWYEFKVCGQNLQLRELLKHCASKTDRFPVLSQLLSIVAILPVSTAGCERGFSEMNLVKDKFRTRLTETSVSSLMMINLNGPSLEDFSPEPAIDRWYFQAKSTRHTLHGHGQKRVSDSIQAGPSKKTK